MFVKTTSKYFAFTLSELLVVLSVLSIITTFTIPKILYAQQIKTTRIAGKDAIVTINSVLYEGWQDGSITVDSNIATISAYVRTKINYVYECPIGASDPPCNHPEFPFTSLFYRLILPTGAWISVYGTDFYNQDVHVFVDGNGLTPPNNTDGGADDDIAALWFNPGKFSISEINRYDVKPGQLGSDKGLNRFLLYQYWFSF